MVCKFTPKARVLMYLTYIYLHFTIEGGSYHFCRPHPDTSCMPRLNENIIFVAN